MVEDDDGAKCIRTFSELQLSELTGITEEQRLEMQEAQERLDDLLRRQAELIERYRAGDRGDELLREFVDVDSELTCSALIDYTRDYNRQIIEILAEAAARPREKTS